LVVIHPFKTEMAVGKMVAVGPQALDAPGRVHEIMRVRPDVFPMPRRAKAGLP
jgi:hypothetical protein